MIAPTVQPDFLVIGAAKAGTTALYHFLRQHPAIFMSDEKEPHFYAYPGQSPQFGGPGDTPMMNRILVTDPHAYSELFRGAQPKQLKGEGSAMYLYVRDSAHWIQQFAPNAKLIVLLRHPVARAYSAFTHLRRDGREPISDFAAALAAEPYRVSQGWSPLWHYASMSHYASQLRRYLDLFSMDQMRVYLYDDLTARPTAVLQDIFGFLGIAADVSIDFSGKYNVSGMPKSSVLHSILTRPWRLKTYLKRLVPRAFRSSAIRYLTQLNLEPLPPLSPSARLQLCGQFDDDVDFVEQLIGRQLPQWNR